MPNQYQLRRRTSSRDPDASKPPTSDSNKPRLRKQTFMKTIRPVLQGVVKICAAVALGMTAAASMSSVGAGMYLFVATLVSIFSSLLLVFMSVLKRKDQTPVYMPDVHNPDGTVVPQQQMTVFDHDHKAAAYFARELPALAIAAAWFFLWSQFRPSFALYAAWVAYRLLFHPLFRVHLWHEPPSAELERPFGAVPIFKNDPSSRVKVVEGQAQFQEALASAKKGSVVVVDCSATWCAPCKQMAPVFEKLAEEFKDVTFLSVDVDISRDVASNLAISSVPSFVVYKDAQRMEMLRGPSPTKLRETIESYK